MSDNGCVANWNSAGEPKEEGVIEYYGPCFGKSIDISKLEQNIEFLSEQVHNAWWDEKRKQGFHAPLDCPDYVMGGEIFRVFKFNKLCDRCHSDCYPYSELPEHIKDYDRVTVRTVLAAIKKMEEV
jgi:hypothetical protein